MSFSRTHLEPSGAMPFGYCALRNYETLHAVIPAQAGIQPFQQIAEELDPSLRWDDEQKAFPEVS
jgi:hypothetical protein